MKKIVIIAILFVALLLTSCTSLSMTKEDIGTYQEVVEVEGATADELYQKAYSWFVASFVDADAVLEQKDKDAHILKGKYVESIDRNLMCELETESVITVELKDGRARFSISAPIRLSAKVGYDRIGTKLSQKEVEKFNLERTKLFSRFLLYMLSPQEDW